MAQDDPSPASDRLICPFCEKRYRYRAELAGRKVRCGGCEAKLQVPEAGGAFEVIENPPDRNPDADGGDYDLSEPPPGPGGSGGSAGGSAQHRCPSCNASVKPTASLCVNCGFDLKEGKRLETRVEQEASENDPQPRNNGPSSDFHEPRASGLDRDALAAETQALHFRQETLYPLILLGAGLALLLFNAMVLFPKALNSSVWAQAFAMQVDWLDSVWLYTKATGAQIIMQLPLMVAAIFLTAALFSSSYGTLGKAMIKLLALVLLVSCFEDGVYLLLDIWTGGFGGIGFLLVAALSIAVFFSLAMPLFDMDVNEAFVLWFITLIGPWVINLFVRGTLEAWGIPVI